MDIRKPRPFHNWREFVKEVGTIVLGVGIALAAEQGVERWREHRQYLADREAVRTELGLQVANMQRRTQTASCAVRRLEEVGALLDKAEAHQPFTPPSWIGRPQVMIVRTASESDISRSTLFPASEQQIYGLIYAWLHTMSQYQDQEQLAWSRLLPLEGRSSLTPEMIADMRAAMGEARMAGARLRLTLDWLTIFARRYLPADQANEWTRLHPPAWPICLPMTTPRAEGERMMFEYIETYK